MYSGESRGGARGGPPPLFLDQTEARRAEKIWGGDRAPPYLRVWMTAPPPLPSSEGLDPPLMYVAETIGSLSNSVFERRTSTGSGLFTALGCGLVETLR